MFLNLLLPTRWVPTARRGDRLGPPLGTRARAAGGAMSSAALRRPGWFRVLLGAVARLLWMLFGVPCGWSLPRADRDAARWGDHFDVDGDVDDDDDAREADARASRLAAALRAAETHRVRHVVGAFDAHLAAVRDILRDWRAPPSVALAGYAHTVYASELFPVPLAPFSRRRDVRALVGARAERLIFLYATASQHAWYRRAAARSTTRPNARSGSRSGSRAVAVNAYTGERVALGPRDASALSALHAADILSVLPSTTEVKMTAPLALALRLFAESAGESEDEHGNGSTGTENVNAAAAGVVHRAAMRGPLVGKMKRDERDDDVDDGWKASARAALDRLARTRSDVVFALRAAGVA